VELPTYTNIWRIEKRLYKLYDFRLPMPLPVGQIAVFTAIAVPYVIILTLLGLPFSHTSFWLYVLPPGVLAWLATRPVLESKRLPELIVSQLRYLGEPRSWCRLAPLAEKEEILVVARVWRRAEEPPPELAAQRQLKPARRGALASPEPAVAPAALASAALASASLAAADGEAQPPRAPAQRQPRRARRGAIASPEVASPEVVSPERVSLEPASAALAAAGSEPPTANGGAAIPAWATVAIRRSRGAEPVRPAAAQTREPAVRAARSPAAMPSRAVPPAQERQPSTARHAAPPPAALTAAASGRPAPAAASGRPAPAAASGRPAPPAAPAAAPARLALPAAPPAVLAPVTPAPVTPAPVTPAPVTPAPPAAGPPPVTVTGDRQDGRPLRVVERALRGPGDHRGDGWHDRVVVVPGGHRPGRPDFQQRDRARAKLPVAGSRRIVVLGCTVGAGQTMTALMTGEVLATVRGEPVAVLDLNPGRGSLAERADSMPAVVAAQAPVPSQLAVISSGGTQPDGPPGEPGRDDAKVFELLSARYSLALADPAASAVPRVLAIADQLVLVAPASQDAARAIAMTLEWLEAHGYAGLAGGSAIAINGVSRQTMPHVEQAEGVARGRCRAIVRVPWDDQLRRPGPERASGADPGAAPPARPGAGLLGAAAVQAYTALAGVLVAGLATAPGLRSAQR
jgi:TcpE family